MKGQKKPTLVPCRSVVARMILITRGYFGIDGVDLDSRVLNQRVLPRPGRAGVQRSGAGTTTGTSLAPGRQDRFECLVEASTEFGVATLDAGWRVQRARAGRGPPA